MRIRAILPVTALALAPLTLALTAQAADTANAGNEARALIGQFTTELQGELGAAIKQGGPVAAVAVCKARAPAITEQVSTAGGWQVGRTSLKTRNPANAPDPWETRVLEQFEQRKARGEPAQGMRYAEVVDLDGQKTYRYMQAIPTAEVCLACHGSALAPDLAEALDKAYPDDQARGYALGDIRGAFTLEKPL